MRDSRRSDFVTRYFLRRLAAVQREHRRPGEPRVTVRPPADAAVYTRALSDAVMLFVLLPGVALFSIGASMSLALQPAISSVAPAESLLTGVLLVTCCLVVLGHIGLGLRLRRFRNNLAAARPYDTDHDREIAFWQRLIVTALCLFAVPLCALAILSNT